MKTKELHPVNNSADILVVIPVKNEAEFIKSCLECVCNQDYTPGPITTVVVDNGSTDDTVKHINSFPKVNLLSLPSGTISAVRNLGASFSRSKYVAFLDGDCVPPENWLSQGVKLLRKKNVSCVGFSAASPREKDSWVTKTWHTMSSSSAHKGTCNVTWLSSFNLILKRSYFEQIGGFDESLDTCEDADLGAKLNKISKLVFSDMIVVRHLGVVRTIREFFLKESWRGKSNWLQFKKSTDKRKDALSVFIPLLYFSLTFTLAIWAIVNPVYWAFWILVTTAVPIAFVFKKSSKPLAILKLPAMSFLAAVYLYARGLAILKK